MLLKSLKIVFTENIIQQQNILNENGIAEKLSKLSLHRELLSSKKLHAERFMTIGDNVDVGTKRRHYTTDRQNQDLHLFHAIAVCKNIYINLFENL